MNIDRTARAQFRLDTNCAPEYEEACRILISPRSDLPGARFYHGMSTYFRAILYRGDAYIMADREILGEIRSLYGKSKPEWFCKFDNLRKLDRLLNAHGYEIADTHVYFLPLSGSSPAGDEDGPAPAGTSDPDHRREKPDPFFPEESPYPFEWLGREEIEGFRTQNPFPHALVFAPGQPDVIAAAARDQGQLIAMAGASVDGQYLWQIGVDVDPEYEGLGLASCLVQALKEKILSMGYLPFYGTSESHALSMSVAFRAGFMPAWSEVFVRSCQP